MSRKIAERMRAAMPTKMNTPPMKGFFPPSHEVLEMMKRFFPLNSATGNSEAKFQL